MTRLGTTPARSMPRYSRTARWGRFAFAAASTSAVHVTTLGSWPAWRISRSVSKARSSCPALPHALISVVHVTAFGVRFRVCISRRRSKASPTVPWRAAAEMMIEYVRTLGGSPCGARASGRASGAELHPNCAAEELRRRIAPTNCAEELRARARGAHVVGHLPQRLVGEGEVARARRGVEQRVVGDEGGAQRAPPHRLDHRRRALRVGRLGERVDQRVARLHVGRDAAVEGVAVELDGEVAAPRRAGARDERAVRHLRRLQPRRDEPPEDALRLAQPLLWRSRGLWLSSRTSWLHSRASTASASPCAASASVAIESAAAASPRCRGAARSGRPGTSAAAAEGVCERSCLAARTTRRRGRADARRPPHARRRGARSQASWTRAVISVTGDFLASTLELATARYLPL